MSKFIGFTILQNIFADQLNQMYNLYNFNDER